MREWTSRIDDTHYCLGSVMGPHPFPTIVRDFQSVISREIKQQILKKEGRLPDVVMACVGGGSNAMGTFYHFIEDKDIKLIGCEAAGRGIDTFETAATINTGRLGIFHGMKIAPALSKDNIMVITISGRGDKDCAAIARYRGEDINE